MPTIVLDGPLKLTPNLKRRAEAHYAEYGKWPDWYEAYVPKSRARAGQKNTNSATEAAQLLARAIRKAKMEELETTFYSQIKAAGLPLPVRQFRYIPGRKFTADFAFPTRKIILEVQGGIFAEGGGGHNRGAGYEADRAKYLEAQLLGWRVFEFGPKAVTSGDALKSVERILATFPELPSETETTETK